MKTLVVDKLQALAQSQAFEAKLASLEASNNAESKRHSAASAMMGRRPTVGLAGARLQGMMQSTYVQVQVRIVILKILQSSSGIGISMDFSFWRQLERPAFEDN